MDLSFKVISCHPTRKIALDEERKRKLSLGFKWTEGTSYVPLSKKSRSKGGKTTSSITNAMKKTCPKCGMVSTPGPMARHRKVCT